MIGVAEAPAPARRPSGRLSLLTALAVYGVISAALFPGVLAHLWNAFPGDLGDPPSQAWILAWDIHALSTHGGTLYDGNIFYPFHDVLAYQDTLLGLLPLAWPLLALSGSAVFTYNVLFLLTFALCAWGAFLLARLLVGDGRAAFVAGLIYGFSAYRMVHLYHLNLLCGMWIPLALWSWEHVRRGERRHWLGVGLFFCLQALSALYYAAFLAVGLAMMLALQVRREARAGRGAVWRLLAGALATACCCAALLTPFFLPYLRVEHALGAARGLGQTAYFSADLRDFLHSVDLSVLYGWSGRVLGIGPDVALQYLWPGLTALCLALLGLSGSRRPFGGAGRRLDYAVVGVAAAVFCLGPVLKVWGHVTTIPLPYLLLYELPGAAGLRDPARFGAIYTLALAVLAAYGAARLLEVRRRVAPLLAALLAALVLAESWIAPLTVAALPVDQSAPAVYRWLAAHPDGGPVLELPIGLATKELWAHQAVMMYYATLHWHPIVNGTGGFAPPGYAHDAPRYASFPSATSLSLLRQRGVRYVVVHRSWVSVAVADAMRRHASGGVRLLRHWPDADLYLVQGVH